MLNRLLKKFGFKTTKKRRNEDLSIEELSEKISDIQEAENLRETLDALIVLAGKEYNQKLFEDSEKHYREGSRIAESLGDIRNQSMMVFSLGRLFFSQKNFLQAKNSYQKALDLARQIKDVENMSRILTNLGLVAQNAGDMKSAKSHYIGALRLASDMQDYNLINFIKRKGEGLGLD
ncbi:MAG: hypothetical protein B6244_03510 [Candidatus Cloacimonetes bacterium 4572_55]|nr:MAG: hypothetical protein B6244_03510 [Candidatus Cloacimonetes bacterium 4572_55]